MTDEHIKIVINLITTLSIIAGATIGVVNFTNKLFKYLEKKAAEKSIGASAVLALIEADKTLRDDFEKLKEDHEDMRDDIHKVQMDYSIIISRALAIMKR